MTVTTTKYLATTTIDMREMGHAGNNFDNLLIQPRDHEVAIIDPEGAAHVASVAQIVMLLSAAERHGDIDKAVDMLINSAPATKTEMQERHGLGRTY